MAKLMDDIQINDLNISFDIDTMILEKEGSMIEMDFDTLFELLKTLNGEIANYNRTIFG